VLPAAGANVVRVLPDVAGIDKEFDYVAPADAGLTAGTEVRVDLSGRRVGGWVVGVAVEPAAGLALREVAKVRGAGPERELIELAEWAAWRWAGRRRGFLKTASATFAAARLPAPALRPPAPPTPSALAEDVDGRIRGGGTTVLRMAPAADLTGLVAHLAQRGPTLVVVPSSDRAGVLAERLGRAGADVALLPSQWAQARAGAAVVIGARAAAWAPCPGLACAVVVDGHDESLSQEAAPTWNAVGVLAERARRAGAPLVVLSPCPTPELLAAGALATVERSAERQGWARIEVIDRRADDPRLGLYSEPLVRAVRTETRILCVLNRTGRARLLACTACGSLATCLVCGAAVERQSSPDAAPALTCRRCGAERPQVCATCHSTRMRVLRFGVASAREDLEALARRKVREITSRDDSGSVTEDVVVGTEAVLHRFAPADGVTAVAFLDFDQELLASRVRAADEAMALLARASRVVRGRAGRVLVQTRTPDHAVLKAAALADPAVLASAEIPIRRDLRMPPFAAVCVVSGPASPAFVAELAALHPGSVEVLGPDGETWLVKADDYQVLCDALAATPRPAEGLRIAVDPARL
jgi:primosomal protein N' (replication factor Y) (superfamily II helicase)